MWFNIGSTDTFERNLENAQIELNMGPENYIPVVYKNEIETSNIITYLPQILMLGKQLIINLVNCYDGKMIFIFVHYVKKIYFRIAHLLYAKICRSNDW